MNFLKTAAFSLITAPIQDAEATTAPERIVRPAAEQADNLNDDPSNPAEIVDIVIDCSDRMMEVRHRGTTGIASGDLITRYPSRVGQKGCAEIRREGSRITPTGTFSISSIVSDNGICGQGDTLVPGATWCSEAENALVIGGEAPVNQTWDEELWARSYGEGHVVMQLGFPTPGYKGSGSCIQIHGSIYTDPETYQTKSGTYGCAAIPPTNAIPLCQMVTKGSRVQIQQ